MKKIIIEKEVFTIDDLFSGKVKSGDYIEWKDTIYKFDGFDWGTYPMATNIQTGEQITLPHF